MLHRFLSSVFDIRAGIIQWMLPYFNRLAQEIRQEGARWTAYQGSTKG